MKIKHRALALILSAIMVLTYMPALVFAEEEFPGEAISSETILEGATKEVEIKEANEYYSFVFTPAESDWYIFSSSGDVDAYARVLEVTSDGTEVITKNDDIGENDVNFFCRFYGEEGSTYYLQAKCLGSGTGNFEVSLNEAEEGWWIINPDVEVECEQGASSVTLDAAQYWGWKGADPGITYEWYQGVGDPDDDEYSMILMEGETSAQITVTNVRREYECVLTDNKNAEKTIRFDVQGYRDYGFGDLPVESAIDDIQLDKLVNVSVTPDDPIVTFRFEPEQDGYYIYESYGSEDTIGQVRTADAVLDTCDDYYENNFQIVFYAEAGETYYLQAKGYNNRAMSFQIKTYPRLAHTEDTSFNYEGTPVTLEVICDVDESNLKFNWYRYNTLIKANGGASFSATSGGIYYCLVSDGSMSNKIRFDVDLDSVDQNNLHFLYECYDDTASVRHLWDDEGEVRLTKGNVTIPSSVKFADGKSRAVTYVRIFAPEMTSVTIPTSVTDIWPGLGMKSTTWDDDEENLLSYELIPGFVIYGKTGSAAQSYANKYKIKFRDPEAEAAAAKAKAAADAKAKEAARQGTPDKKIAKVKISKPSAGKKSVTAKWKKLTSKQIKKGKVKKYEIWVCPNKAFGPSDTIMKEVSKSKSSGKVKVPKKGKYYVKVRAIRKVGGVKHVGKWSSPKKVKVKK